jgi:hypothetical protein
LFTSFVPMTNLCITITAILELDRREGCMVSLLMSLRWTKNYWKWNIECSHGLQRTFIAFRNVLVIDFWGIDQTSMQKNMCCQITNGVLSRPVNLAKMNAEIFLKIL